MRQRPFPGEWLQFLRRNVLFYEQLTQDEREKLQSDVMVLVHEKNWEGCGGLEMSDEIRVTIAGQACLLILGLEDEYFDLMKSILVYPNRYIAPNRTLTKSGVVIEGDSTREGEAWYRGPVVLSWADALAGGRGETNDNVVLHEFAHQLDMRNGRETDGIPPLNTTEQLRRWQQVMTHEFVRLQADCEHRRPTVLDCYAATNHAELFAVATEAFFVDPQPVAAYHADLYAILRDYYRQDPVRRVSRSWH